jgi:hypothetical protein
MRRGMGGGGGCVCTCEGAPGCYKEANELRREVGRLG